MTIKTLLQTSEITNIVTRRSDMQKRGAVKNLFNTTVDREELQKQAAQLESESLQKLERYKVDSIIDVIHSANEDQARRMKRSPMSLESDDESSDEDPSRIVRHLFENDKASSEPTQSSSSKKSADLKLIAPLLIPLPKGQKTLKGETTIATFKSTSLIIALILDYFPIVKRKRHRWWQWRSRQTS